MNKSMENYVINISLKMHLVHSFKRWFCLDRRGMFLVFLLLSYARLWSQYGSSYNVSHRVFYSVDTSIFTTVSDLRIAEHNLNLNREKFKGRNVWNSVDTSTMASADNVVLFRYRDNTFVKLYNIHYDCVFKSDNPELYEELSKHRDWGFKSNAEKAWSVPFYLSPISKYTIQKDTVKLLEINRYSGVFEVEKEYTRNKTQIEKRYQPVVWFDEEEGIYTVWYAEGPVKRKVIHLYELYEETVLLESIIDKELGIPLKHVSSYPNAKYITYFSEN